MPRKIGVLVGSIRKESFNRKIVEKLIALAPAGMSFEFIKIDNLPLYNPDIDVENSVPVAWQNFRAAVRNCDAILFATPEYNRSIPGVLKNAIDVGSRPYGKSAWDTKPAAVISASMGAIGGFGANHHLRQILVFLNMPCMQQPEAYLGQVQNLFAADGIEISNAESIKFFQNFITSFAAWVDKQLS